MAQYTVTWVEQAPTQWNETIAQIKGANILQTTQWAEGKIDGGWKPLYFSWRDESKALVAAALILRKKIVWGMEFWYCPRGPLVDWENRELATAVLDDLSHISKKKHAISLKLDPAVTTFLGVPGTETGKKMETGEWLMTEYQRRGFVFSSQQIQIPNTILIDCRPDEETLLAEMKQSTRYKVRVASKKGVTVRKGTPADFDHLYQMYHETAARDQFIIREKSYYLRVWQLFYEANMLTPLIAEVDDEIVSALMLFIYAKKSWYIYGMSSNLHREKMPNYLLQWAAIKESKLRGAETYDLWGAPDVFDESDRMWGVYQFKRGLGGVEVLTPGAYDLPHNKPFYALLTRAIPAFISILKRKRA